MGKILVENISKRERRDIGKILAQMKRGAETRLEDVFKKT